MTGVLLQLFVYESATISPNSLIKSMFLCLFLVSLPLGLKQQQAAPGQQQWYSRMHKQRSAHVRTPLAWKEFADSAQATWSQEWSERQGGEKKLHMLFANLGDEWLLTIILTDLSGISVVANVTGLPTKAFITERWCWWRSVLRSEASFSLSS